MKRYIYILLSIFMSIFAVGCHNVQQNDVNEIYAATLDGPPTPTAYAGPLSATVNVSPDNGELDRQAWFDVGWGVSSDPAQYPLDLDCTLHPIPDTRPQQWVGRCWGDWESLMSLPNHEKINVVLQVADGTVVQLYSIDN